LSATSRRSLSAAAATLFVWLIAAGPVAAHDGLPGLLAAPDPVNPGGTVEIRGDNLGSDESVAIALVLDGGEVALASGVTDGEGHLLVYAVIPADVPVATYVLRAQAVSGYAATGTIELAGVPLVQQPDTDRYERGPIMTPAPVTAPGPASGPTSVPVTRPTALGDMLVLVGAIALPLAAGLALLSRRRRTIARG
jgi:hypothetical protein